MKIYPVLSSDLYVLSCVPVSRLEQQSDEQMLETLSAGGQVKFLVASTCSAGVNTATGFMSKHVDYQDVSSILAHDFQLRKLVQGVDSLSDYVLKNDMQNAHVYISALPNPYIISSFQLSNGYIYQMQGYELSDALLYSVPRLGFQSLSAGVVSAQLIVSPTIDEISSHISPGTGQLVDKEYVDAAVKKNASSFRGTFQEWSNVPEQAVDYELDEYGRRAPDSNDYMVVSQVSSYPFPETVPTEKRSGSWRFRFTGTWTADGEESKNKWRPEYSIVNMNMTAAQLDTLNSGVTKNNRVIKTLSSSNVGTATRGVYVTAAGEVVAMSFSLEKNVTQDALFTDTVSISGDGVIVSSDTINHLQQISLSYATKERVGGLRLGNGLRRRGSGTPVVDVATKVEIADVEQDDLRTVEEIAAEYSDWHQGGILIVRRGYQMSSEKSHTGYVYDGGAWIAMDGNCCADNVILPDDIEFSGGWTAVGNIEYSEGGYLRCGGKSVSEAFRMIFGDGNMNARVPIPAHTDSFTYDGNAHSPFASVDERIVKSGTYEATDPGSYACTLSLPAGQYEWSDGTTGPISVEWKILPDTVSLTLDSNEP